NAKGKEGDPGDKHYRCCHGNHHILTITKKMNGTHTAGLVNHLERHVPHMYSLFKALKERGTSRPASEDEIRLAKGERQLSPEEMKDFSKGLGGFNPLEMAFARQGEKLASPWDQSEFERQLAEWVVVNDQPFTVVES
ncbi:hypothetical protein DFH11DRAFT_1468886, partial [Phellopilus nigrolimitatus]